MTASAPSRAAPGDSGSVGQVGQWTVAICAVIGLGLSLAVYQAAGASYEAEALIAVSNPTVDMAEQAASITSSSFTEAATSALGERPDIDVTFAEVARLITVRATADGADLAATAANTVADIYVQNQVGAAASIAQSAEAPAAPSGVGPLVYAVAGSLLGALGGLVVRPLYRLATGKLASTADATTPSTGADWLGESPSADTGFSTIRDRNMPDDPATPTSTFSKMTAPGDEAPRPLPGAATGPHGAPAAKEPPMTSTAGSPTPLTPMPATSAHELRTDDRRPTEVQVEALRYELLLAHEEEKARVAAEHEQRVAGLRTEIASLQRQLRTRRPSGNGVEQARLGDLEAQVASLENELASIRDLREKDRIAFAKQRSDDRTGADRILDEVRRRHRAEVANHLHDHREALADYRTELDAELSLVRAAHAQALEDQHRTYEAALDEERTRHRAAVEAAAGRHEQELEALRNAARGEVARQAAQYKRTIAELREVVGTDEGQRLELEKQNRALRAELSSQRAHHRHAADDHAAALEELQAELAEVRDELTAEQQRNAALRADVLRASADSHGVVDQAIEERTAQLAELEASVARQREYAEARVREVTAAAEEQARQAAAREAELTATISKLRRELAERLTSED